MGNLILCLSYLVTMDTITIVIGPNVINTTSSTARMSKYCKIGRKFTTSWMKQTVDIQSHKQVVF